VSGVAAPAVLERPICSLSGPQYTTPGVEQHSDRIRSELYVCALNQTLPEAVGVFTTSSSCCVGLAGALKTDLLPGQTRSSPRLQRSLARPGTCKCVATPKTGRALNRSPRGSLVIVNSGNYHGLISARSRDTLLSICNTAHSQRTAEQQACLVRNTDSAQLLRTTQLVKARSGGTI
jgi:hypothetical protein